MRVARLLLASSLAAAAQAQEVKPPEFVAVHVGFADRYKVGLWTPIEVTLRGGSSPAIGRVRATSERQRRPELLVRRAGAVPGASRSRKRKSCSTSASAMKPARSRWSCSTDSTTLAAKTFDSAQSPTNDQFADALRPGQRLIVSVGKSSSGLEKAVPGTQGQAAQNVVAAVDSLARLPTRWQGYEGVDIVVISTSRPEVFAEISPQNARIEALEQWVRMGGTLVLCAGSHAEEALHAGSPLARFVPGRFEKTVLLRQTSGWETYAKSVNPIPPPKPGEKVELPTAQARRRARQDRSPRGRPAAGDPQAAGAGPGGLRGHGSRSRADPRLEPIARCWSPRSSICPSTSRPAPTTDAVQSYGYNDLAGQLRSALDVPRDVHLVPFFVVALLVIVYILLIGPGDYFLLRRLGRGMQWTWITFPAIVVLFSVGAYLAAYWLKGDQLRVSQVDLVDIDAEGTARGASWFSIFSPRGESFDLSMRPRLPDGQSPQETSASLAWLGKAGNEFNGMYGRDTQNSAPLWSQGYRSLRRWTRSAACRSRSGPPRVLRTAGWDSAADLGLDASLKDDEQAAFRHDHQPAASGSDPQAQGRRRPLALFPGLRRLGLRDRHASARRVGRDRPGDAARQLEHLHQRRARWSLPRALPRNRKKVPTTAAAATWPTCCRR